MANLPIMHAAACSFETTKSIEEQLGRKWLPDFLTVFSTDYDREGQFTAVFILTGDIKYVEGLPLPLSVFQNPGYGLMPTYMSLDNFKKLVDAFEASIEVTNG